MSETPSQRWLRRNIEMKMATRKTRKELERIQLQRRNAIRTAARINEMGEAYLLHPENKGVNWRAAQ